MCLVFALDRPGNVLGRGTHAGFEWIVVHNDMGHRCDYVKVGPGHPWHGVEYDDVQPEVSVHGGLTFAEADAPCPAGGKDDGWWLGFDTAHCGDAPDPSLTCLRPVSTYLANYLAVGVVRSQVYVEAECKSLCEQAAAVAAITTR